MDSYRPILKTVSGICKLHDTYLVGYHLSGEEENDPCLMVFFPCPPCP